MTFPEPGNPRIVYPDQIEALVKDSPFLEGIDRLMVKRGLWKIANREDMICSARK